MPIPLAARWPAVSESPFFLTARATESVGVRGFVGVVRTADERTGFDVDEAEIERGFLEIAELVGVIVPGHRGVPGGRPEILTNRQNRTARLAQVPERGDELLALLAEADHQPGLGRNVRSVAPRS